MNPKKREKGIKNFGRMGGWAVREITCEGAGQVNRRSSSSGQPRDVTRNGWLERLMGADGGGGGGGGRGGLVGEQTGLTGA